MPIDPDEWSKRLQEAEKREKDRRSKMPVKKSPKEIKQYRNAWQKENTHVIQLRFTKSSGIYDTLVTAARQSGVPYATYLRKALIEKLQRDGYITETPEE